MPFHVARRIRRRLNTALLAPAALAVVLVAACPQAAHAQYLINPTGGTLLFSGDQASVSSPGGGSDADDDVITRTLGFNFSFFGGPTTNTIDVSTNGHLNFVGDSEYVNVAFPDNPVARIAPLFDDLKISELSNASISEISNANYFAVTYNLNSSDFSDDPVNRQRFQVALFGATTVIGTRTFNAGDIAFSYNTLSQRFTNSFSGTTREDATIGLDAGDGTRFATAPNAPAGGLYSSAQATSGPTAVPLFPRSNQIILFRPTGSTYTSSIVSVGPAAVGPEPASVALLGTGLVPLARFVVRRRRCAV